ncbi:hypothetical protein [Methylocaldum szegediense]|jgi:hypothetical protein|nr:hypothetical protein [Methylocaldum szegediense]
MSKVVEVKLNRPAEELVAKAKEAARDKGIHFVGDEQKGQFAGNGIEGHYRINGDTLSIRISKKPLIVPWNLIEAAVRSYFG